MTGEKSLQDILSKLQRYLLMWISDKVIWVNYCNLFTFLSYMLVTERKSKRALRYAEPKNPLVKDHSILSNFSYHLTQLICFSDNLINRNFNSSIYSSEQKHEAHKYWYLRSHNVHWPNRFVHWWQKPNKKLTLVHKKLLEVVQCPLQV